MINATFLCENKTGAVPDEEEEGLWTKEKTGARSETGMLKFSRGMITPLVSSSVPFRLMLHVTIPITRPPLHMFSLEY
jgi:hypothetical protein